MRYRIYFKSGNVLSYKEGEANFFFDKNDFEAFNFKSDVHTEYPLINVNEIDYIVREDTIENPVSGVVKPASPQDLKRAAEEARLKRIENPQALVTGIRQKAEPENEDDTLSEM